MDARSYLENSGVEKALSAAVATVIKERPINPLSRIAELLMGPPLKMTSFSAYWHPCELGMAEKGNTYDKTAASIAEFAAGLTQMKNDACAKVFSMLAEDGAFEWHDPMGAPPTSIRADVKKFLDSFPPITMKPVLVKVAADETQGAAHMDITLPDGGKLLSVAAFQFDAAGKVKSFKAFWHPAELGMAERKAQYEITAGAINTAAAALTNMKNDSCAMVFAALADDGIFTWNDPVGAPTMTTRAEVKTFLDGFPPAKFTAKLVKVAADEYQGAAHMVIQLPGDKTLEAIPVFSFKG